MKRCEWVPVGNELYVRYHDEEWGVPVHDDVRLFEMLVLEGAQAGLFWSMILKKRENYRAAFDGFDFKKVALYSEEKVNELLGNEGIVRNRLKIRSAINNAKVFIEIRDELGSFDNYIWGFARERGFRGQGLGTKGKDWEPPVTNELSDEISLDLRKRGMSFVGSTIIYAFMQAVGIVDDHEAGCFRRGKS